MLFDTKKKPYRQSIRLMENFQTCKLSKPAHPLRSMALAQYQCQRKNTVYALI